MKTKKEYKNYGARAFIPLLVFLALYIGSGLFFTIQGKEDAFSQFPRHVALLAGIAVALLMNLEVKIDQKIDCFSENAGNPGVMLIGLIYLLAGGFQGAAKAMGGMDSIVNMGLHFIPPSLLIPGIFVLSSFIATAIGTSMGTIAAVAPIAIGVATKGNLNLAIACSAVIGGAYFGDNLSIISDTTISATQGVGAEMKDKFRMNLLIALPAAVVAVVLYAIVGGTGVIEGDLEYRFILIIPYFAVLITALMGFNVAGVLFIGILMCGVIGLVTGSIGFFEYVQSIGDGMSDMFSITIIAILISGLIGIIKEYGGIEWLINAITSRIKDRKGAEYGIAFLSGLLSISLVNNTLAIIISAPIAKEIGAQYHIAPKRLASLLDIFACAFLALCPHDGGMLIVTGLSGVSPIEVIKYSFYMFALIAATVITIQFGLLRTPEEKEYETKVRLESNNN
ncbi:Na+/H+ antiporter NhaC family protein [Anaerosphaera multitolerans]|uniref:Na+/H+ antiporter NhaC family protein n=1 Tax=Anaerosphaera multitolerans TaxID=2487351 RepID=A0A437S4L9_9FIRM|nr:Na+/H+ antiporter NhaC family protein [Anaerosphaera multitolerans]RVU53950.1 Na+/H+ antiporter NhaC family protein [Anaerosphaera multitolerans]